jgi:DNA-binding NarL/FixJ family response regulator
VGRLRVLIADDDVLLREGMASLLAPSPFEVIGLAGDVAELMRLVRRQPPELVVLDIRMPPSHSTEGLDAARSIRSEFPDIGILVLSAHVEVHRAIDLLSEGQRVGYLLKSRITQVGELIETLERIAAGGSVMDPGLVKELVDAQRAHDPLAELTPRERQVLQLMAEGRSNAGIARALWVTEGTVHKHVRSILSKLPLSETEDDHRRVLAVITFLQAQYLPSA